MSSKLFQGSERGIRVRYLMCGDGKGVHLKSLATQLRVEDQVVFTGRLSLEDIFSSLMRSTSIFNLLFKKVYQGVLLKP